MVEIPIEQKSNLKWLWLLLAVLLLGLLLWWALDDDDAEVAAIAPVEVGTLVVPEAVPPVALPEPVAQTASMSIGDILGNPAAYVGRHDFEAAGVQVPDVATDRGICIED